MARFLRAIKEGRVKPGSILLVEALDRLTRQDIHKAYTLFNDILSAGVDIVTLYPYEMRFSKNSNDLVGVMIPLIWFHLGHIESLNKSKRVGAYWDKARKEIQDGTPIDSKCPAWCDYEEETDTFKLNEGAKAVEFIFRQTVEGKGQRQILRELNEKFEPIGTSGRWNTSYVQSVLSDRTVLGERERCKFEEREKKKGDKIEIVRVRVPVGPPVRDYYPAVIEERLWYQAQSSKAKRRKAKGQHTKHINLFVGTVLCGFDGRTMHIATARTERKQSSEYVQRRFTSYGHISKIAGSCPVSLDYYDFEKAMLQFLRELNPAELEGNNQRANVLRGMERELAGVEEYIAELQGVLADRQKAKGRVATLANTLAEEEAKRDTLKTEVEKLRAELHSDRPLEHAQSILEKLAELGGDELHDARLRLRGLIAELVESFTIWPEKYLGRVHAAVRIAFRSGDVRNIAISGDWSQWQTVLEDDDSFDKSPEAITSILANLRERADRIAKVQPYKKPKEMPETVGELTGEWLKFARSEKKKDSFRTIPAHVARFVKVIGADTATVDTDGWAKWVSWLRREVKANRMEANTARVGLNRTRECVRWMIENGRGEVFDGLEGSVKKMFGL